MPGGSKIANHSMKTEYIFTLDKGQVKKFAGQMSKVLCAGITVALRGDLGTGKTTFARYLIQTLAGKATPVPSPTFTLVQMYDCPSAQIWHYDLYRLNNEQEAIELGMEDAFYEHICLIEWPERIESILPENRMDITFTIYGKNTRTINSTLHPSANTTPEIRVAFSQIADIMQIFSQPCP
jgi:tRNA threonylcarbamoyladenosine biosynthesis protein TsaE